MNSSNFSVNFRTKSQKQYFNFLFIYLLLSYLGWKFLLSRKKKKIPYLGRK